MNNQKKVVLITGISSGIGFESAKWLAQSGYNVYGGACRVERMEVLKQCGVMDRVAIKTILNK